MKSKLINLFKNQKGQAIVEFALILPVFMLILGGIIEGGWLFSNQLMISNVSREGARIGVIYSKDVNQLDIIKNKVLALVPDYALSKVAVSVAYSNPTSPRSGDVSVNVTYDSAPLTPVTGIFTSGNIMLSSKCVMKLE